MVVALVGRRGNCTSIVGVSAKNEVRLVANFYSWGDGRLLLAK